MDTITIATKDDKVYIVMSNGRHRVGMSCESMEQAEARLKAMHQNISLYEGWFYIDQELEEVRSYKSGKESIR